MTDVQPEIVLDVRVPGTIAPGVYANAVTAWFCETDLTIDFAVNSPLETGTRDDGTEVLVNPLHIVARIKMTPGMAVYVGVQLAQALADYEQRYGNIARLTDQPPLIPPSLDDGRGGDDA
ncbi:MAG: hypothetical protein ACHQFZ_04900 [Acidimicrobiales bacterium]